MKYLLIAIFSCNAFAFWDSELSNDVDQFIYDETVSLCSNYKKIKSISVNDIIDFPQGQIVTINYVSQDNRLSGEMVISKTMWGDLYSDELVCPKI